MKVTYLDLPVNRPQLFGMLCKKGRWIVLCTWAAGSARMQETRAPSRQGTLGFAGGQRFPESCNLSKEIEGVNTALDHTRSSCWGVLSWLRVLWAALQ